MAFDIYGNHLRPGYCEVHPDVREEWPCHECLYSYDNDRQMQRAADAHYDRMMAAEYDAYCRACHIAAVADCAGPGVDARAIIVIDAPGCHRILPSNPRAWRG